MSSKSISLSDSSNLYDFTTNQNKAYGMEAMAKLNNSFGMYAGDGDANGTINIIDYGVVVNRLFDPGYKSGDLDMNGIINVIDYTRVNNNLFKTSKVPDF